VVMYSLDGRVDIERGGRDIFDSGFRGWSLGGRFDNVDRVIVDLDIFVRETRLVSPRDIPPN
jgi:hypothetical protein